MTVAEIEAIIGWDHKRLYGYDFAKKLSKAGFDVSIFEITDEEARLHGISSNEFNDIIFVAEKPNVKRSKRSNFSAQSAN